MNVKFFLIFFKEGVPFHPKLLIPICPISPYVSFGGSSHPDNNLFSIFKDILDIPQPFQQVNALSNVENMNTLSTVYHIQDNYL